MYAGGGAANPMRTYTYPGGNLKIKDGMSELMAEMQKKPAVMAPIVAKYALKIQSETKAYIAEIKLVEFGTLMNSIEAVPTKDPLTWLVQDGVYYGIFHELGTSRGITAKHFLGRTVERNSDPFIAEVKQALAE